MNLFFFDKFRQFSTCVCVKIMSILNQKGDFKMNIDYEINCDTLAIIAENGFSKVIEREKSLIVMSTPFQVMEHSCRYFGSSYNGREIGTKDLTGMDYKVPICVSDNMIFFPTCSPRDVNCCFLAFDKILKLENLHCNQTRVWFDNKTSIVIPISCRILNNQLLRSFRLFYIMKTHKNV